MLAKLISIWSTVRVLVACTWQMTKMVARFYAAVIPATARVEMTRRKKRSKRLDRYLVECGAWRLRATIHVSGTRRSLSSLSVTMRTAERASTSTVTTERRTALPPPDASLPPVSFGRQLEPSAFDASS